MNQIKKEILEIFEEVEFIPGKDDELLGYAEMFGNDCIPLYRNINFSPCSSFEEAIIKKRIINPKARAADGFEDCILGFIKLETGQIVFLYDKEKILEQLVKEYSEDTTGLFSDDEDLMTYAIENYDFNIIGSYMEGIPAFAIIY
jgi:hypothetical protein